MAIELEILEGSGYGVAGDDTLPCLRAPLVARQRITAAGLSAAFNAATKVILLRNLGDPVNCRWNATGITTNAGTGDGTSFILESGAELLFDLDATGAVKIDVRAATLSSLSAPAPTGAATAAKQDTLIGHVDGIEAALALLGTEVTLAALLDKFPGVVYNAIGGGISATYGPIVLAYDVEAGGTGIPGIFTDRATAVRDKLAATSDLTGLRINNAAASGDTALVAAVSGQTTKVHALRLSAAGACVVQIRDGATVLEVFNFAAAGSVVIPFSARPIYKGTANTALNLNVGTAVQVDGRIEYLTSA